MRRYLPYIASALITAAIGILICTAVIYHSEHKRTDPAASPAGEAPDAGQTSASLETMTAGNEMIKVVVDAGDVLGPADGSLADGSEGQGAAEGLEEGESGVPEEGEAEDPGETSQAPATTAAVPYRDPDHIVNTDTTIYTYDMMRSDLYYLTAVHPDIMELWSLGTTEDGRELYVVFFGNRRAERQIFICGATHAREYMTAQLVMKQLEFYAAHYNDQSYNGVPLSEIFSRTCFVVMPMVNPDGVSISQLGEQGIRRPDLLDHIRAVYASDTAQGFTNFDFASYLVRWKANALGTDINRNFSPGWETISDRPGPSADHYKGAAPGDQIETSALMWIMQNLSNPLAAVSYHSYGNLVYYQYGQQGDLYARNEQLAQHICNMTGYTMAGYSNEAGFANWCVRVRGIPAVVVETGSTSCPLPLSQFPDLWARHQWMWAMLGTVY